MQRIADSKPDAKDGTQIFIWDESTGEYVYKELYDIDKSKGVSFDEYERFFESLKDVPNYDSTKLLICTRVWCVLVNTVL